MPLSNPTQNFQISSFSHKISILTLFSPPQDFFSSKLPAAKTSNRKNLSGETKIQTGKLPKIHRLRRLCKITKPRINRKTRFSTHAKSREKPTKPEKEQKPASDPAEKYGFCDFSSSLTSNFAARTESHLIGSNADFRI